MCALTNFTFLCLGSFICVWYTWGDFLMQFDRNKMSDLSGRLSFILPRNYSVDLVILFIIKWREFPWRSHFYQMLGVFFDFGERLSCESLFFVATVLTCMMGNSVAKSLFLYILFTRTAHKLFVSLKSPEVGCEGTYCSITQLACCLLCNSLLCSAAFISLRSSKLVIFSLWYGLSRSNTSCEHLPPVW